MEVRRGLKIEELVFSGEAQTHNFIPNLARSPHKYGANISFIGEIYSLAEERQSDKETGRHRNNT